MPAVRGVATGCLLAAVWLLPGSGGAQPPAGGTAPIPSKAAPLTEAAVVARVEQAIDRGLKHLAAKQLAESGALSLAHLITHRQPVASADSAYRTAFGDSACLKMILDWSRTQ